MRSAGVERLIELFRRQVAEQKLHEAAQLAVLRRGRVVVDEVIGYGRGGEPIKPDTPFLTFSATKAFTGVCIHKLIEEGKVALDAPVAEYWPAFGQKGKEQVTIRQVFTHRAGIPLRGLYSQIPLWPFWGLVTRHVARLKPEFEPGGQMAYHLMNYGFILGEVARRVSGQRIEDYLHEHFIAPLGLRHTWMRIPKKVLRRSPRLHTDGKEQNEVAWLFNRGIIRRAALPAASLHSTARDLASFYQMLLNGGEYNGRRYLKTGTLEKATELGYEGRDALLGVVTRWAYGFHLGGVAPPPGMAGPTMGKGSTARTFGHHGNSVCMAWADPDAQLVAAFVCNGILPRPKTRARWTALSDAVWDSLAD